MRRVLTTCCVLFFSFVSVTGAQAGILDLEWTAPITNADGTTLTDLSGYRVYWGTSSLTTCPPSSTPQFVSSPTPSPAPNTLVTSQLTGLITGTTYFVRVTAVDFSSNESVCSTEASGVAKADAIPPTVSISSPSNGAFVRGTITVTATASDNEGVAGVQFRLDGANLNAEDTTSPYSISWNTTSATNGSHTLTAIARDTAGNTTTSGSVTVTVDNSVPTVSITAPTSGTTVTGSVTITATASDNTGGSGVAGVQFRVDGNNIGSEDTASPYSFTWNSASVSNGSHTLTAVARDAAGNTTTSSGVPVTTVNSSPPPPGPTSDSGGGGGGCFIATAAFGSALEPQVVLLRAFRDQYLLTNAPGQAFVQWYYRTSPPLAEAIRQSPTLRGLVRVALWPVVGLAWLSLHPGVGGVLLGGIGGLTAWGWARRRAPRGAA